MTDGHSRAGGLLPDIPKADLTSHRITGYLPDGRDIDLPLYSEIVPGLWSGGCIGGVCLPGDFRFVLSLYKWERYTLGPDTERVEVTMYDSLDQAMDQVAELAELVNEHRRAGDKTLVHCQAGINRSALVTGAALVADGVLPGDAIALLRERRSPLVLANKTFEAYLIGSAPQ